MQAVADLRRRGSETFRWHQDVYDISALLQDLERGAITGLGTFLNRHEIEVYRAFLEGAPHPALPVGTAPSIDVDVSYASTLRETDLERPIILLHVGHDQGTIELADLECGYNFVVGDGNHRLIRAYQVQLAELPIIAILEATAKRYRSPLDVSAP
ncbi:hypothetical protein F6X40_35685 [Paraburkholderia sp. UCT31]|uniref:hypothetical protein n=1 Tax=Paraburkholderia sp. UCT31 TaxID=2615209 RepID=UPI0016550FBB|nr:hypothetical protein [Paraburkholderia sp. UCT31]MBC8741893.1 hypothetical protein [Paraburkholderia sp. UCT31]